MTTDAAYEYLAAAQAELASQRPGSDPVVNVAVRDTLSFITAAKAALDKARQYVQSAAESIAA